MCSVRTGLSDRLLRQDFEAFQELRPGDTGWLAASLPQLLDHFLVLSMDVQIGDVLEKLGEDVLARARHSLLLGVRTVNLDGGHVQLHKGEELTGSFTAILFVLRS